MSGTNGHVLGRLHWLEADEGDLHGQNGAHAIHLDVCVCVCHVPHVFCMSYDCCCYVITFLVKRVNNPLSIG